MDTGEDGDVGTPQGKNDVTTPNEKTKVTTQPTSLNEKNKLTSYNPKKMIGLQGKNQSSNPPEKNEL